MKILDVGNRSVFTGPCLAADCVLTRLRHENGTDPVTNYQLTSRTLNLNK